MLVSDVQFGRCRGIAFDQGAEAWAIVLPGSAYSVQAPLLWYAREVALAAGRSVLVVTDSLDRERDQPMPWVEERSQAALDHLGAQDRHPLLIAKSLTSLAAPLVARAQLPAIWLTPLISARGAIVAPEVLSGLQAATEPRLLVGGLADPTWDGRLARSLIAAEILELPDADHALEMPGDPTRSLANLATVVDAMAGFLSRLTRKASDTGF